jgi:hypothetical protein
VSYVEVQVVKNLTNDAVVGYKTLEKNLNFESNRRECIGLLVATQGRSDKDVIPLGCGPQVHRPTFMPI